MGETQGVRVLVVDDDVAIREFVAMALGMEGCTVRTAEHGREALRVAAEWSPDLIVLDLNMPVMDGWTFREEQKRHPRIAGVPVIVASAGRNLAVRPDVLEPCKYLEKPFDLDDLYQAVGRCAG